MKVQIFDVEHGFCALVTGRNGERILVDCGHNSSTGWRPSQYLPRTPLDLLIITNYDQDHLSDFVDIQRLIGFNRLCRNFTLSPEALYRLKVQQDPLTSAMNAFISSINGMGEPTPTPLSSVDWAAFYIPFPPDPTETNAYSVATFIEGDGINIVFPGDLTVAGWRSLLLREDFRQRLARVNIFVASHHGRENGYCSEVFRHCQPNVVIVSDDSIQYDTQRGVDYGQHAKGHFIAGEIRKTLTTRCHGNITIQSGAGLIGSYMMIETEKGIPAQQSILATLLSGRTVPPAAPIHNTGLLGSVFSTPQQPKASSLLTSYIEPRTPTLGELLKRRGGGNV